MLYFMYDELVCYVNIMNVSANATGSRSYIWVVSERAMTAPLLRQSIKNKTALDDMRNGQQFHLSFT